LKPKEHQKNIIAKRTKVTYKTTHKALQTYTKIKQRMKNYKKNNYTKKMRNK
jgi:hypothetical protein